MKKYTTVEKLVGETPLETLGRVRARDHLPDHVPLAYAGRLDPMASGKLLVLIGEECKRQDRYHSLDKEYDFEILLGAKSDTGDILGLTEISAFDVSCDKKKITNSAKTLQGEITLPYPLYSSKTVRGKPLFLWTLEDRLNEIELPSFSTILFSVTYKGQSTIDTSTLSEYITGRIGLVTKVTEESKKLGADFRRKPILDCWKQNLELYPNRTFSILRFTAICSSGTYIRALAPHIASLLGTTGLAYSIHRTKMGRYRKIPLISKGFWFPSY